MYYKATNSFNRSAATSQSCGFNSPYVITYEKDKWVYPADKRTKLFVFDDYEAAERFGRMQLGEHDYRLWECEVENPDIVYPYFLPCVYGIDFVIKLKALVTHGRELFEEGRFDAGTIEASIQDDLLCEGTAPNHTVFVSAVKLTKEVTPCYA